MPRHTQRRWSDPILDLIARLTASLITVRVALDRTETGISKYFRDNTAWGIFTELLSVIVIMALIIGPAVLLIVGIAIL